MNQLFVLLLHFLTTAAWADTYKPSSPSTKDLHGLVLTDKILCFMGSGVAQLVDRAIPEVRGSNPVIGKNYILNIYCHM